MNLYLLGWRVPDTLSRCVIPALEGMTGVYPRLDRSTLWMQTIGTHGFVASMHTASAASGARACVWRDKNQAVLYEGSLVDPTGGFRANDAAALARNWEGLAGVLEGQFVVARATTTPPTLEVLTDVLGLEQVYFLHRGPMWLLSNSVRLLSQLGSVHEFDALGVSLFLAVGWVGSDRTLRSDINVMPGGQRWTWREGTEEATQQAYYPVARLARQPRRTIVATAGRLANDLVGICTQLARDYGPLYCPLTGGRDSRLLAALLIRGDVEAEYYTGGDPAGSDVHIGKQIARMFNLSHACAGTTQSTVLEQWDAASARLVAEHDGMVSLWHIADILDQPETLGNVGINLWGIGGEIARGMYGSANLLLFPTTARMQRWIVQRFARDHGGLVRRSATALASRYLQQFVESQSALGFRAVDIPDAFFMLERVRRWAGTNGRKSRALIDSFAPLGTRPFVEAAFALSARRRCTEPLHFEMLRQLNPALHTLPLADSPWSSQRPLIHLFRRLSEARVRRASNVILRRSPQLRPVRRKLALGFNQVGWLEAKRPWLRELCLEQRDSTLWEFIDRHVFERVTSDQADASERRSRIGCLYSIATLFRYELT